MYKWIGLSIYFLTLVSCKYQNPQTKNFQKKSLIIEIEDQSFYSPFLYIGNHFWIEDKLWFITNFSEVISVDSLGKIHERINMGKLVKNQNGQPVEYKDGMVIDFFLFNSEIYALYLVSDKLKKFTLGNRGNIAMDLPSKEDTFFLNYRAITSSTDSDHKTLFVLSGVSGEFDSYDLNIRTNKTKPLFKGKFVPDIRSFEVSKSSSGNFTLFDFDWNGIMIFNPSGKKIYEFNMPKNSDKIHPNGKENFQKWFRLGFEELGARIINVVGKPEDLWVLINLNPTRKANGPSDPYFIMRKNKSEWDFFQINGIDQIDINEHGLVLITNLKNQKVVFEIIDFDLFTSTLSYSEN